MKIIDYWIILKELVPPMGKNRYFAKIRIIAEIKGEKRQIGEELGECYGSTEVEAEQKMETKYRLWLEKQSNR